MINIKDTIAFEVVCPLAEKDVDSFYQGLKKKRAYLNVKNFVAIGNKRVGEQIKQKEDEQVKFVDEDQFISYDAVKTIIANASKNDERCIRRTGWYLQQFLKFSYSLVCEDDWYLLWDADTIPIHDHIMMVDGHPIFDMKTEHHEPYFTTFSKLLPQYPKRNQLSYISEHMLIKTKLMRELIHELEKAKVAGDSWHQKIINSIDLKDLPESGFCDYDTYGLFILNNYPELYKERMWDSLRPASRYFEYDKMRECDYEWLRKDYDAVSFEAGGKVKPIINHVCINKWIQTHFSCRDILRRLHQFTI